MRSETRACRRILPFSSALQFRFAGMMQYDGELHVPKHFLVPPPLIERASEQYVVGTGLCVFACSESQKIGAWVGGWVRWWVNVLVSRGVQMGVWPGDPHHAPHAACLTPGMHTRCVLQRLQAQLAPSCRPPPAVFK
mgnify:CR=1 FL=1